MALQPIWIPAPSLVNWAACSYTVTSMPTRRSAAAAARPPMPAPTIAIDRGLGIDLHPPFSRIGKEQLLAIDLVAGNRRLSLRGDQPVHERLAGLLFHGRVFFGVHQHDAVLIEQPLVTLDNDPEIAAILER